MEDEDRRKDGEKDMSKSYWQKMHIGGAKSQAAVKSWFGMCVDESDTVREAEILCDKETDREKKIRAVVAASDGATFRLERTLGGKQFTIKRSLLTPAPESPADERDGGGSEAKPNA